MSSVLVLSEASVFTREQLGTRTGKGLASALSVTASARKVQNRDKEKQKLELEGVPTTFINGEQLPYDLTAEEFENKIIELISELK